MKVAGAVVCMALFSGCAGNPFDPNTLLRFPPGTVVDERVHLSRDDENQIYRLVYKAASQRIDTVLSGTAKNEVEVICGYNDIVNDVPRLTGDSLTLRRIGAKWTIVEKSMWMR